MEIYGNKPAWFALCSTPILGGVISFAGLSKWANEAAEIAVGVQERQRAFEAGRHERQGSLESEVSAGALDRLEQRFHLVQNNQAFYSITGALSAVLSLALVVQCATVPVFALLSEPVFVVSAVWTAVYVVGAYFAARQVDRDLPSSASFFVNAVRYLYNSALL